MIDRRVNPNSVDLEEVQKFTLRVSFTGLCAFVPRGESEEEIERMDIFLIDPTNETEGKSPESHSSVLSFYLKNLRGSAENGDLGETRGFWELYQEDVEICLRDRETEEEIPLVGGVQLKKGRKPGPFWEKPMEDMSIGDEERRRLDFEAQKADFSWLPEIAQAVGEDAAVANSDLVDDPNPSRVASARFRITHGIFGTHSHYEYRNDIAVAQFVPPLIMNSPYVQAMAQSAGIDVEVDARFDVVFRAIPFEQEDARELVLRVQIGEQLTVEVSNLCCGDYFAERPALYWKLQPDHDFEYVYLLCDKYNTIHNDYGRHWPIPVTVRYPILAERDIGGVTPIRCSGGMYKTLSLIPEEAAGAEERGAGRRELDARLAENLRRRTL